MVKKVSIKSPGSKFTPESDDEWVSSRELTKRLTVDVPVSFHSRLKIASVKLGLTMGDIVREAIEYKLDNVKEK